MRVEIIRKTTVEGRSFHPGDSPDLPDSVAELLIRTGSAARSGASAEEKRALTTSPELATVNRRDARRG